MKVYNNVSNVKRGDIFYADLPVGKGHVQGGVRPVLIISNDVGNRYSPVLIVCPLTTRDKKPLPTHTTINAQTKSTVLCEQQQCIDKEQLVSYVGTATESEMKKVDIALAISIGLNHITDFFKNCNNINQEVVPVC